MLAGRACGGGVEKPEALGRISIASRGSGGQRGA